jgi:hypothetical protein
MKPEIRGPKSEVRSTRLLAEQIVDDIMCRRDGSRRNAFRLMLVTDKATDSGGAGWGRQPLIDRIQKHLKANSSLITHRSSLSDA